MVYDIMHLLVCGVYIFKLCGNNFGGGGQLVTYNFVVACLFLVVA